MDTELGVILLSPLLCVPCRSGSCHRRSWMVSRGDGVGTQAWRNGREGWIRPHGGFCLGDVAMEGSPTSKKAPAPG